MRRGHFALHAVILWLATWRAAAMPCSVSKMEVPAKVEGTSVAYQLAEAVNCSGGSFEVEWVGLVNIDQPIRILNGTTLRITGTSDGSSVIDGASASSLFEVLGGTLHLSRLTLANGSANDGGAVYGFNASVKVSNCTFVSNTATLGGGILLLQSGMEADNSTFIGNTATDDGGAIYAQNSSVALANGSSFVDNVAERYGGALYGSAVFVNTSDSIMFKRNTAELGGAAFLETSMLLMDGYLHFANNVANHSGGAVYAERSDISVTGIAFFAANRARYGGGIRLFDLCTVTVSISGQLDSNNNEADHGGGMWLSHQSNLTILGSFLCESNHAKEGAGLIMFDSLALFSVGSISSFNINTSVLSGGGIYMSGGGTMIIEGNATFAENRAELGAGIYLDSPGSSQIKGTRFQGNQAMRSGGAITMLSTRTRDAVTTVSGCTFIENEAGDTGGAFLIGGGFVHTTNSTFLFNRAGTLANGSANDGGAVYGFNVSVKVSNCTFVGNTATLGGGILLLLSDMEADNSTFIGNNATDDGGAIYAQNSSVALANRSSFVDNVAERYGGALYGSAVFVNTSDSIMFKRNTAELGGATFLETSMLLMDGYLHFANNVANHSGGAVYAERSDISVTGIAFFAANRARYGGGIRLFDLCTVTVSISGQLDARNNEADQGGGMWLLQQSILTILGSFLCESNHAKEGAGLIMFDSLALFSVGSISSFNNNTSVLSGGGIHMSGGGTMIIEGNATFAENRADLGGGISVAEGTDVIVTGNITITGNVASSSGGGIYLCSPGRSEIKGTTFLGNQAKQSGGAITMFSTGTRDAFAKVSGCTFIRSEAGDTGGAFFVGGGFVNITKSTFQFNRAERAGGAILVSGVARVEACVLEKNEARLGPGIYNTVSVTLESTDVCNNQLLCDDGNFLDWHLSSAYDIACDSCPAEGNACTMPYNSTVQLCEPVLEHTTSLSPSGTLQSLYVKPGYWRSSTSSRDMRECYESAACVGGTQELCKSGYGGPFCAVCVDGYARGVGYTCVQCSGFRRTVTLTVMLVLLVAAMLITVAVCTKFGGSSAAETTTTTTCSLFSGRLGMSSSRFEITKASQAFKIVVVVWQIVTQFAAVTSTTYPAVYATFLGWADVLNLNIAWILSAGCVIESSFHDSVLVLTLGTLGFAGVVLISHVVNTRRCHADDREGRAKIDRRHGSVLFWTSFLMYSTVSSSIFQTFVCDHLDDGKSFLRADHSLECYTSTHKAFMAYAGVMVAVYPIGIPACYALVLYRSRASLKAGQVDSTDQAAIVKELWAPYRPRVYFYKVVECLRCILFSGAVVLVYPNSSGQVATSLLLAMLSAAVLTILDPYARRLHTWLARASHAVVILSMYLALLQKVDDFADEESPSQHVFACMLVALNCGLLLAVGIEAYAMCSVALLEIREPVAHVAPNQVKTSSRAKPSNSVLTARVAPFTEFPPETYEMPPLIVRLGDLSPAHGVNPSNVTADFTHEGKR